MSTKSDLNDSTEAGAPAEPELAGYQYRVDNIPEKWYPVLSQMSEANYPVDPQLGGLVQAAYNNYVIWYPEFLRRHIEEWVRDSYLAVGHRRIRTWGPESKNCHISCLEGVADEDFLADCDGTLENVKRWMREVGIDTGRTVSLPTIPLNSESEFLKNAPLVGGRWIDAEVIVLAELGNALRDEEFTLLPPIDQHPDAWQRIFPPGTNWLNPKLASWGQINGFRRDVRTKIQSFVVKGGKTTLEDRLYLDFRKYMAWRARCFPGKITEDKAKTYEGIVGSSWNSCFPDGWEDDASERGNPKAVILRPITYDHDESIFWNRVRPSDIRIESEIRLDLELEKRWQRFEEILSQGLNEARKKIEPPHFEGEVLIWNDKRCDFSRAPDEYQFMIALVKEMGKPVTHNDLCGAVYGATETETLANDNTMWRNRIRSLKRRVCARLNDAGMQGLVNLISSGNQKYTLMIQPASNSED